MSDNKGIRLKVRGLAMYARVHEPQKAFKPDEPSQYTMDLLCSKEEAQKLLGAGVKRAKQKVDEDTKKNKVYGEYPNLIVFALINPTKNKNGQSREAPKVVDAKGTTIPKTILIGNGSEVVAHVDVYDTETGKGKRLVGVQVIKLVPFERASDVKFDTLDGYTAVLGELNSENVAPFDEETNDSDF